MHSTNDVDAGALPSAQHLSLHTMAPKKSKANPRDQYFQSIKSQKLDTLRWCLRHGGVSHRAEDDEGHNGLMVAAAGGFDESLELLIDQLKRVGELRDVDDPDEEGRTPLMMAAHNGKLDCVRLLVLKAKASLTAKCEAGKTARMYAAARKNEKVTAFLDDPKEPVEEEEEEEETAEEQKARQFAASKMAGAAQAAAARQEEVHKARVEAAEALEATLAAAKPVWPEVEAVLDKTLRSLSLKGKEPLAGAKDGGCPVDPAIWSCVCLFELRIETMPSLTTMPPALSRLSELTTLIVSFNSLGALPDELCALKKLRNLEAAGNQIAALPAGVGGMATLQTVDLSNNALADVGGLKELTALVSLKLNSNKLTALPLAWAQLEHLGALEASGNAITEAPAGLGCCQMLVSLDLSANKIAQIPIELGNLTPKKLQTVRLHGNPLADPRIRRFVENDEPSLVKDLLNHVKKNGYKGDGGGGGGGGGKGKGKKGKKGKAAKEEEPEDEEDTDANIADLLAAMGGGSGSDED